MVSSQFSVTNPSSALSMRNVYGCVRKTYKYYVLLVQCIAVRIHAMQIECWFFTMMVKLSSHNVIFKFVFCNVHWMWRWPRLPAAAVSPLYLPDKQEFLPILKIMFQG